MFILSKFVFHSSQGGEAIMNLSDIPDEIILIIFRYLPVLDIAKCRLINHRFNALIDAEQLWKKLCYRDYAISASKVWYAWNSKDFYTKVLHKFRYLFGWWKRELAHFGGIIKIQVEQDGIFAYDCLPPLDDSFKNVIHHDNVVLLSPSEYDGENLHKFRFRRIFCLKSVGKQVMCFCYQSMLGHLDRIGHSPCPDASSDGHSCVESCNNKKMFVCKTEEGCKFVCHQPDRHDYTLDYWFEIEHGFRATKASSTQNVVEKLCSELHYYCRLKKFDTLTKLCCYYDLTPITVDKSNHVLSIGNKFLPLEGIYFGTYSAHGWEIIDVRLNESGNFLEGIKITGDPNIPAGQVTFRVHLDKPLFFNQTDQLTLVEIRAAIERNEATNYEEIKSKETFKQSVTTPFGFFERGNKNLPSFCLSRFVAEGQIAGNNFRRPSFTPCVFMMFDEHFFGLLWLELQSISLFYRANNSNEVG